MAKQKSVSPFNLSLVVALAAAASTAAQGNLLKTQCGLNEIHLVAHVREPGCYRLLHLNEVCVDNKQCIDEHTFCGHHHLSEDLTSPTVCVCKDDTKEVHGRCVIRDHCCLAGYNPDHLQADCPKRSMFCAYHRCHCKPGYKNDRTVDDCVLEEEGVLPEEEDEEVGAIDGPKWEQCINSTGSDTYRISLISDRYRPIDILGIALLVAAACFVVFLLLILGFYKLYKKYYPKYENVPQKEQNDPAQSPTEA